MDYRNRVVPFYMAYPAPYFVKEADNVLRDLEYLEQLYPAEARRYQRRIADILDTIDYEGSIIYDEYPDRWQLYSLGESVLEVLRREEEESGTDNPTPPEKWEWVADMIQLLLYSEIYKRRRCPRQSFLKF